MKKGFYWFAVFFLLTSAEIAVTQTEVTPLNSYKLLKTHKIYLAAVDYAATAASQPGDTPQRKFGRPQSVPNSFKVLVYGLEMK